MRFVSVVLSLMMVACSCATVSKGSNVAIDLPQSEPAVEEDDESQSQILLLGQPSVQLDVDFDPTSTYRVGRVRFDVPVTGASAEALAGLIVAAKEENLQAVVIDMNTPGGSVSAGLRVAKVIEESPVPVFCVADGMVASMGMYLLQSCHHRLMTKRTVLMAHAPAVAGELEGNSQEFKNLSKMLETMEKALAQHICSRMTVSEYDCRDRFSNNKEWWIDYEEAMDVGAVDHIVLSAQDVTKTLREKLKVVVHED